MGIWVFILFSFGSLLFFKVNEIIPKLDLNNSFHVDSVLVKNLESSAGTDFNGFIIASDTVIIDDNLKINGLSMILICNKLICNSKQIMILPNRKGEESFDENKKGKNGAFVHIITKSKVDGSFILPGGDGGKGENGADGKSGSKDNFKGRRLGTDKGGVGGNGENGGDGGSGGRLTISTIQEKDSCKVKFEAKGGIGGPGGKGGVGGWTYVRKVRSKNYQERPNEEITLANEEFYFNNSKEKDGVSGRKGNNGKPGAFIINQINEASFIAEIKQYGLEAWNDSSTTMAPVKLVTITKGRVNNFRPIQFVPPGGVIKQNGPR